MQLSGQQAKPAIQWPLVNGVAPRTRVTMLATPQLTIGTSDGPDYTLFNGIAGAVRLSDGGIAVGDAGNNRGLLFDSQGRYVRSIGRSGDGPGEFRSPLWFGRCADGRIAIQDGDHARVTFFSPDGTLGGSRPMPVGVRFDPIVWCSGGAQFVVLFNRPRGPLRRGEGMRAQTAVVRVEGTAVDTIVAGGVQEYYVAREVSGYFPVPLGEATLATSSSRRLFVCANLTGHCQVFDTSGTRIGEFALGLNLARAGERDWQRAVDDLLGAQPSKGVRQRGATVLKELQPREAFPLVDQIRADAAGNLWVRTFDNFTSDVATWVVVTERGAPLAVVATPRALHVLDIGRDYVLGFTRDGEGVERIQLRQFTAFAR